MDFETLKTSSSNFDKLTKALETNLKPEDQSNKRKYEDDRFWKPESIVFVFSFVRLDFYQQPMVKICHGRECGLMLSKIKVVGILRTL